MVKIIIVGAGISGLSTYLLLRKHLLLQTTSPAAQHEIKIYEAYDIHQSRFNASSNTPNDLLEDTKRDEANVLPIDESEPMFTPQAIGSAIGISKNGLSVLSRLDTDEHKAKPKTAHRPTNIIQQMAQYGHPIERWEIGTARGFTIVDVNLSAMDSGKLATPETPTSSAASQTQTENSSPENSYHGIMIARQACWEILRGRVLAVSPQAIIRRKIVDVRIGDETVLSKVIFEDGGFEEADLVVGADGLRSILRRAMFRDDEEGSDVVGQGSLQKERAGGNESWFRNWLSYFRGSRKKGAQRKKPDFISPHYEGLVGVGGFMPSSVIQATGHKPGTMSIVFGPNGFFGYGYLTSSSTAAPASETVPTTASEAGTGSTRTKPAAKTHPSSASPTIPEPGQLSGWWSTFSSPNPYPYAHPDANGDPSQPSPPKGFNKTLALEKLLSRHSRWKTPPIHAILAFVKTDTDDHGAAGKGLDASYPTWTTSELPFWSLRGRAVLVGDAAHALQPSSGQGACQALEDAEALALCLARFLGPSRSTLTSPSTPGGTARKSSSSSSTAAQSEATPTAALTRALTSYEKFRMPRVHEIHARSQAMSRMKADMNVVAEHAMYAIIWISTWRAVAWLLAALGAGDMKKYNERLVGYDLPAELETFLGRGGGEGY